MTDYHRLMTDYHQNDRLLPIIDQLLLITTDLWPIIVDYYRLSLINDRLLPILTHLWQIIKNL